jgi:hypothetical protein
MQNCVRCGFVVVICVLLRYGLNSSNMCYIRVLFGCFCCKSMLFVNHGVLGGGLEGG